MKPEEKSNLFLLCFTVQAESKDALYFVGLFRIANVEFLPEYRQKESREFRSVAQNVQQVVRYYVITKLCRIQWYSQQILYSSSNQKF